MARSLTGSAITATADTSTITLNAATDLGVDAGGDITLDADSGNFVLKTGATTIANDLGLRRLILAAGNH